MGGGGKGGTSTSTVKIPKEVLARYNAVNTRAETAAAQPFQQYGGQFVAGINPNQQAGINATSAAAGIGQDYYNQARGMMAAGSGAVNPDELDINKYLSPYTENVVEATRRGQEQQNRQQAQQLAGNAISQGAFGGDRAGIAQANLAGQQSLANQQTLAGLRQQGYTQALGAAQQQQGLGYQAQAANLARQMQGGQGLAGLGAQAQTSALQGAQAQIGAGTLEQQTQQADLSARYNQFLQEQGFPYQQAQFLANIAMGTGALSGSTTTNVQPTSFFSDERLKEDIKPIGKTFDGQPIYSYKMKGDPRTQIGLLAQEVEGRHPEAVGLARGYKTVDYDKATEHAAHRGHFYRGGLASSAGGGVGYGNAGEGYADGGMPIGGDIQAILAAQKAMFPYQGAGLYGGQPGTGPHGIALDQRSPDDLAKIFNSRIGEAPAAQPSGFQNALNTASQITSTYDKGKSMYEAGGDLYDYAKDKYDIYTSPSTGPNRGLAAGGRIHYDMGGSLPYGGQGSPLEDVLKDQEKSAPDAPKAAAPGAAGPSGFQQALQTGAQIASIASLFAGSDRRLKEGIEPIGKTFDGQVIHKYRYKGDPRTQIGLIAQEVERHHPDAVGLAKGYKTVNYDTATRDAANRGHFQYGGLAGRSGYGPGGTPSGFDAALADLLKREGGLNPNDAGAGMTNLGMNQRANPDVNVRDLTPETARPLYLDRYYKPVVSPEMSPAMQNVAFDTSVLFGPDAAKGLVGQAGSDPAKLLALRDAEFRRIAQNPEKAPSLEGWLARNKDIQSRYGISTSPGAEEPKSAAPSLGAPSATAPSIATPPVPGLGNAARPDRFASERPVGLDAGQKLPEGEPYNKDERLFLPLATGIGTMLASRSPFLLNAVGEGLVGGAGSYASLQQQQAAARQKQEQIGISSTGAETSRIQTITDRRRIDLETWEKLRQVAQYSIAAGGKVSPEVMAQIEELSRRLGVEVPPEASGGAGAAASTGNAGAAPQVDAAPQYDPSFYDQLPDAANPVKIRQKAMDMATIGGNPKDLLDSAAAIEQKMAETGVATDRNGKTILVPGNIAAGQASTAAAGDVAGANKAIEDERLSVRNSLPIIQQFANMMHQFDDLPPSGLLAPGYKAEERLSAARTINTLLKMGNGAPLFNERDVAAGEELFKDTRRLGQDLARQLGGGPAASIVEGAVGATPSMENSALGYRRIMSALQVAQEYKEMRLNFLEEWRQTHGGTLVGADAAWIRANPPEQYVKKAMVGAVLPVDADKMRNADFSSYGEGASEAESIVREQFDGKYGTGAFNAVRSQ